MRKRSSGLVDLLQAESPKPKKQRLSRTCEWIDSEQVFRSWLAGESSSTVLWITGSSGSGKTFLSQYIVDKLDHDSNQAPVLSYFCDEHSSPDSILRSLFAQLLEQPSIGDDAKSEIALTIQKALGVSVAPLDASYRLWDSLQNILGLVPFTLILDGLDELSAYHLDGQGFDLVARLVHFAIENPDKIRLLVSSRENPTIQKTFQSFPSIELTREKVRGDMMTYIRDKMDLVQHENPTAVGESFVSKILEESNGNFIWIDLVFKIIRLENGLDETNLDQFTGSLDDLYARLYDSMTKTMHTQDKALLVAILRWTVYSIRPITPIELSNAVSVSNNFFLPEIESHISNLTQSLVKVENGILKPWHVSFRNFVLGQHSILGEELKTKSAHLAIAESCLIYLLHHAFQLSASSDGITDRQSLFPLMEYATLYWIHHTSHGTMETKMKKLINKFFESTNAFVWVDVLLPAFLQRSILPPPPRPSNSARFAHVAILKGQLVNSFDDTEKPEFERKITEWLCSSYERELATEREWAIEPGPSDLVTKMTIRRILDLAEIYGWLPGKRSQSQTLFQDALVALEKLSALDADLDLKLSTYQAVGDGLKRAGKYREAKQIFLSLLEMVRESLPSMDSRVMFAFDSIGWVSMRLDELEDAAIYLQRAINIAITIYGYQSPQTLRSKLTLAEVLVKLGKADEAMPLFAELAAQVREYISNGIVIPKDSISQLKTLAAVYRHLGSFAEAADVYTVVVQDRARTFGDEHPMTLWAMMQLGSVKAAAGDVEDALKLARELRVKQIKVLGEDHPDVMETGALINKLGQA